MTRRFWIPVAAFVAACFATGVWAVGVVRGAGGWLADTINGGKR